MTSIRFSAHARDNMQFRGAASDEVIEAIHLSEWGAAEAGRYECRKNFEFGGIWNGKYYATKQVRPIFVQENDEIIIVTVYVYYF
ncbi:MAG: hypothetical protein JW941_00630 [Candidatus Coatesbacteria bacterium]|nr:hypothetical protein [Candidatus Coatesbacteria bacterium]